MFDNKQMVLNSTAEIRQNILDISSNNKIQGKEIGDFIFDKMITRIDPVEYCEKILRNHLPDKRRFLHDNQKEIIRAVANPRIRKVAALQARQSGKCFSKNTEILMADNTIKMVQDIKVGDYVMSPSYKPVLVTSLGNGKEEMYEIYSKYGSYTVNQSHILTLKNEFGIVKNITVRDYLQLPNKENLIGYRAPNSVCNDYNFLNFKFNIRPKGIGEYYGFTIDSEDHLFLLGDYTVVHNTESIASFTGFLLDNYPGMRVGIFTPRIQQAEIDLGRLAVFFQMNEGILNNKLIRCNKQKIELSNGSFAMAVSGSDQSNIEGFTFDIIVLDEAQKITNYTWSERIVPMGGACLEEFTKISLPNGELITIKELVERKEQKTLISINEKNWKMEEATIDDYIDSGIQPTIKITLNSGRTMQGTLHHPVIIKPRDIKGRKPKWEKLENLKIGMQVGVPKAIPYFGIYENKYARLLGMLIGDGSYGKKNMARYCSEDDELWDYIKDNFPEYSISIYNNFTTKLGLNFRDGTIKGLCAVLKKSGIYGQTKEEKRLPTDHNTYTKESLADLMGGLYDTDGSVDIYENRKITISLAQSHREILDEIQMCLLKFGIHSRIRTHKKGKNSYGKDPQPYFILDINDKESIENFHKNIKFLIKRKQDKLNNGIELLKNHKNKIQKDLLDTDLRFERIVKVEDTGLAQVYDLTVKDVHNFIANGIYAHNTNAKLIKIGTPKFRNHFYDSLEGQGSKDWYIAKKDWTECPQLWALDATYLPDPKTKILRPYSTFVLSLMPKSLKQEMFPDNPEIWTEGEMSVEDFKTQYALQFVDGASQFLTTLEWSKLTDGDFSWMRRGLREEKYAAGIDFAGSSSEQGDFTHLTVVRIAPNNQKQKVFGMEMQGLSYPDQMNEIGRILGGPNPLFSCQSIFADYTGCGRPVVETLREEYGMTNLTGIIFNATDTYTKSGMNMKNAMFNVIKNEISYDRFKYPKKELFLASAGSEMNGLYHKMVGEWKDLEAELKLGINKRIEAPNGGHDDCPMADSLANFAAVYGSKHSMPRASHGRMYHRG